MTIYNYAKLSREEKKSLINNEAIYLENYKDNENSIHVYYLNAFFVEVIFCKGIVIDILPFKRGYKMGKRGISNIQKRNASFSLAA